MLTFIEEARAASEILKNKYELNAQFDVIRDRIESRPLQLATPAELVGMIRIVRQNDRLTAELKKSLRNLERIHASR